MWQNLKSVVGIKSQPVYLIGSQNQSFCAFCFHALVRKMGFLFERLEDSYENLTLTLICLDYDLFITRNSVSEGLLTQLHHYSFI